MTGCKPFADFDARSEVESFDDSDMAGVLAPEGDYEDNDCSCSVPSNEASNDDQTNCIEYGLFVVIEKISRGSHLWGLVIEVHPTRIPSY